MTVTSAEVPADLPAYDRDEWGRWSDADGDCQDTRQEVLIAESLVPVTYQTDRQCRVAAGEWFGAFTGTAILEPSALDIDHLVPLANAHKSGGWAWPEQRRRAYYNSLDDADHLISVTASANRSKGARGPEEWRPIAESYWWRIRPGLDQDQASVGPERGPRRRRRPFKRCWAGARRRRV